MSNNPNHRLLPDVVMNILVDYKAWIVGSGADWYLRKDASKENMPRDLDVLVPPECFIRACRLLKGHSIAINSFGGIKFSADGVSCDVWGMSLEKFMTKSNKAGTQRAIRLSPNATVTWER